MGSILDFGIRKVEELSEFSLALIVFRLNWLSSHNLKPIFLEGLNARPRPIEG
jgi:hypothetical protein